MKRLLTGLGLTLLGSVQLIGCADDSSVDEDCLPGDIECAAPITGGKGDAWDPTNNPAQMSQSLNYKLTELPKKGSLKTPTWKSQFPDAVGRVPVAWADTYWPTSEGSHNARWQGAAVKSPLEKYDAAFNSAAGCATMPAEICGPGSKAKWDTYYGCAGPAAKWQSQNFQGGGKMHDGIDNNGDGKIDECYGDKDADGIAGWWGTCHAWTPASLLMPEPQHSVTMNGQTFEVADIKALTQNIFDSTSAIMLGGRCNSKEVTRGPTGSANEACRDVNPGSLHVILTNFLGIAQLPLIEDRTANFEVWNQPVVGYEVTKQVKVTASKANTCVGATGSTWKYNANAKDLYEVNVTVNYITEGQASTRPMGFENNISTDDYHYILEIGSTGKVIGGRFCKDSEDTHVDFLWTPTGRYSASNPNVNVAKVKELIAKSISTSTGGGGSTTAKVFTATPASAIPDNAPAGVTVDVPVTGVTGTPALTVSVDISHTYRGDLAIDLLKDGTKVKTLVANQGGSAHDIKDSYNVSAAEVGASANARWSVKVVDNAAQDTGTVNSVKLSFE
ncbi:MAG: proprotein convertase P-domain-containing protein [Myxococcales bacterium]|nr:proprotein convertase P-domain-containing protein [Myxococcales bacterium]